jgi:hypothetical protein
VLPRGEYERSCRVVIVDTWNFRLGACLQLRLDSCGGQSQHARARDAPTGIADSTATTVHSIEGSKTPVMPRARLMMVPTPTTMRRGVSEPVRLPRRLLMSDASIASMKPPRAPRMTGTPR